MSVNLVIAAELYGDSDESASESVVASVENDKDVQHSKKHRPEANYFDSQTSSDEKGSISSVDFDEDGDEPEHNDFFVAPHRVETPRLYLQRVCSAKEELDGYQRVFDDYSNESGWPTDCSTQKEAESKAMFKEVLGFYQLPLSFNDYNIHLRENRQIIGRFAFRKFGLPHHEERPETTIYFVSEYRGKGYGAEVIAGIVQQIVQPALGKPYKFVDLQTFLKPKENESIEEFISRKRRIFTRVNFPGVFAHCTLANHKTDNDDYGSIKVHHTGGYGIICKSEGDVDMSYPPKPNTLSAAGVQSLIKISKILRYFLKIKEAHPDIPKLDLNRISIEVREILKKYKPLYESRAPSQVQALIIECRKLHQITGKEFWEKEAILE